MAKKKRIGSSFAMYAMLAPYMALLIVFGIVPIIMAIKEVPAPSRVNQDGGWDAFKIVLQDFRFLPALKHVLGFMAIYVPITTIFVIAVACNDQSHFRKYLALLIKGRNQGTLLKWLFLLSCWNRSPHVSRAFEWMAWSRTPHTDTPLCKM